MTLTRTQLITVSIVLISLLMVISGALNGLGMSAPAQVALGILLIAATLWVAEAIPLFVTSLLVLFLAVVWLAPSIRATGQAVDDAAFLAPFFSDVILLFLGGFVLSAGLNKLGLDERLARWILLKTGSSVPRLMFAIMLVTAVLSMWLSNTSTAAMMLALVIPICRRLPESDRYRQALLLCVPFAANIGGLGTPIGSPPNAIAMRYMQQMDAAPSFGTWMIIGVPGSIGLLVIAWLLLLWLFPGTTKEIHFDHERPLTNGRAASLLVVSTAAMTALGWLSTAWHGLSSGTIALIPVLVLFGAGVLNVDNLRRLPWDVLLLMGGGLCLGSVIAISGLASWLVQLMPISGVSAFWLMVAFGTVACLMSSVMSNTAASNLVMPIILGLNIEPLSPLLIGTAFACSLAMPLPVSTPPNAMAFSTGEIKVTEMLTPGLLITAIGLLLSFTLGYWWWDLIGLF